ncbi:MAG: hypothetical protein ACT6RD_03290 [Brevundimonas sp.]|uniref:hypothetical protein n=1 Tax=Brevundimonas sp. TaxID=1871086 RepID=UPI0040343DDE
MASFEHPRKVGNAADFAAAYEGWRRLQELSGETARLPPGPETEVVQNAAFEACERAEQALLRLTPRSDSDAAVLIEVLLGNEEVETLGGPTLRRIQAYLSAQEGAGSRRPAQTGRHRSHHRPEIWPRRAVQPEPRMGD